MRVHATQKKVMMLKMITDDDDVKNDDGDYLGP